jgi:hypothetical protein
VVVLMRTEKANKKEACSSGGGGDFVEVVALCGVVMVWFGWVVVDSFGLGFGVDTICGQELEKGWLGLIRCLGCVCLHHLISCRFVLHFVCWISMSRLILLRDRELGSSYKLVWLAMVVKVGVC